jgi:hypothetical protein
MRRLWGGSALPVKDCPDSAPLYRLTIAASPLYGLE